ncbi:F-box/RNI superfamily protein, putative [Medicago truncatula]|uniref:F-box/RNI superfamily protein, putative n=1 Tax=Medicago truncatula TaxID=3880 RepID=A0A072TXK2_MEDTR|nr:F-box/RNI superfamily protein, putative [Medicago truncatula]
MPLLFSSGNQQQLEETSNQLLYSFGVKMSNPAVVFSFPSTSNTVDNDAGVIKKCDVYGSHDLIPLVYFLSKTHLIGKHKRLYDEIFLFEKDFVAGISALPDSVICHILSFLPTKQSAATSILSKRWNPLWHSVFTLNFDDQSFTDFHAFRLFVYSVMLIRDPTLPIRLFHLKCGTSPGCYPHDINRFVPVAVKKGIENLILDFTGASHDFLIRLGLTFSYKC